MGGVFCTDRKAYAVALQQEGTGYICGKEKLRWPEYREQGGAWCEMRWWHSQTMQSLEATLRITISILKAGEGLKQVTAVRGTVMEGWGRWGTDKVDGWNQLRGYDRSPNER